MASNEGDADALFLSPDHATGLAKMLGGDHQIEPLGNAERTGDVERGPTRGKVADGAIDRAAAELDGSGF